jgi:hypothetical protein
MMPPLQALERELDAFASEAAFSGVVRIDRGDRGEVAKAFGLAHRGYQIPNDVGTQFAIASGTKGLTALTVVSLIAEGILDRSTTARSLLGPDLPLIRDDVTVEHLLSHRSGIGDYFDEEAEHDLTDYVMPVPVHELATPLARYLDELGGHAPSLRARCRPVAGAGPRYRHDLRDGAHGGGAAERAEGRRARRPPRRPDGAGRFGVRKRGPARLSQQALERELDASSGSGAAACCPGSRRDHKWCVRKQRSAAFAQLLSAFGVEPGDIRASRADAECERLPPLFERRMLHAH